jgi:hypothetical protein
LTGTLDNPPARSSRVEGGVVKRSWFLLVAGVLACGFGIAMLLEPGQMLTNMTSATSTDAAYVLQWMGVALLSVGFINILSRNDPGSAALRAILVGNIVLHVLGFGEDFNQHRLGFVLQSGVVMGGVVHGLLTIGFVYYLVTMRGVSTRV